MICEQMFRLKKNGEPYSRCFCRNPELIENYNKAIADKTQVWECHHRMEAIYTKEELIKYGLYYDREPHQLIFLTKEEHRSLHHKEKQYNLGRKLSDETKSKISSALKGRKLSEETKAKLSDAHKGKKHSPLSDETKAKLSSALKGRKLSDETKTKIRETLKGHKVSEETKSKISTTLKGKKIFQQ